MERTKTWDIDELRLEYDTGEVYWEKGKWIYGVKIGDEETESSVIEEGAWRTCTNEDGIARVILEEQEFEKQEKIYT